MAQQTLLCSAQKSLNYVASKAWFLIRGWAPFLGQTVVSTEPFMWCFVPFQLAESLTPCIFRNCTRLHLSACVTVTGSCISSGMHLWNTSYLVPSCSLSWQNRNHYRTKPKWGFPPLEDLMVMHLFYHARPPTRVRWNDLLNILRRLNFPALCWMCDIPGKVSTLLWYCTQGKDYCFSVNYGWI